ncbi:MAG: hypothetical protein K6E13_03370 [Lachnospiraceae bacterium]|nr:hypothetical protein [Lachnospiraceae bacterium]
MEGRICEKRAKFNLVPAIKEAIESAFNGRWKANKEDKHNLDAARGWRTYNVRFGIENNEGITYFAGKLKVRMDANGTDYAYDIVIINKKGRSIRLVTANSSTYGDSASSLKDRHGLSGKTLKKPSNTRKISFILQLIKYNFRL